MNSTIVIYGSSTGTCEAIAEKIASLLGCKTLNVQDLTADIVDNYQNLVLGTSTWGAGELQDDWYDGLKTLQGANLNGKTIALFGCGDCSTYADTFVGGMGENSTTASRTAVPNSSVLSRQTATPSTTPRLSSAASSLACLWTKSTRTTRLTPASAPGLPLSLPVCNHRYKI